MVQTLGPTIEVDDRLGGLDDAVGVGDFDEETLEELFIDGVEKVLLVREAPDSGDGTLDGDVRGVQVAEEFVRVEGMGGECVNDAGDLVGDDVAAGEAGVVEGGT